MKVIVFDPRPDSRDALRRAFAARGGAVKGYAASDEAAKAVAETSPDVLVADLASAAGSDAVLQAALAASPRPRLYALVDAERLDDAVAAIARGADDFLWRPVSEERVAQLWSSAEALRARDD